MKELDDKQKHLDDRANCMITWVIHGIVSGAEKRPWSEVPIESSSLLGGEYPLFWGVCWQHDTSQEKEQEGQRSRKKPRSQLARESDVKVGPRVVVGTIPESIEKVQT